jgi:hypothetical protein
MNSGLTPETAQTLINFGNAFDWYAYAQKVGPDCGTGALHGKMGEKIKYIKETSRLHLKAEDNFAVNSYLHRSFHHSGYLPEANTDTWYDMVFLYLHLYRLPVQAAHQHPLHSEWVKRPKGAAEAAAAEIRQVLRRGQIVY